MKQGEWRSKVDVDLYDPVLTSSTMPPKWGATVPWPRGWPRGWPRRWPRRWPRAITSFSNRFQPLESSFFGASVYPFHSQIYFTSTLASNDESTAIFSPISRYFHVIFKCFERSWIDCNLFNWLPSHLTVSFPLNSTADCQETERIVKNLGRIIERILTEMTDGDEIRWNWDRCHKSWKRNENSGINK